MSKTHGQLLEKKSNLTLQKTLINHDFTNKIRDSGYSNNHFTFDKKGWYPHES